MDDMLPLFIYIVGLSSLNYPASELNFIQDYLRLQTKDCDTETMIVTTLLVYSNIVL
jgi:hypothetical protein